MCKRILLCVAVLTAVISNPNPASAQLVIIDWTGLGDGTTWEDANNWFPNTVPDAENHVANFTNFDGAITFDGSRGTRLSLAGLNINGSREPIFDFSGVGFAFTDLEDIGFNIGDSTVTFNTPIDIDAGPGNDTMAFNFFAQQFSFTSITFNELVTTNDKNVVIFTPQFNSVLVRLTEDFDGGNGDVSVDGTVSVGVDMRFIGNVLYIDDGDVTLINETSQYNGNVLYIDDGSFTVKGGATPNNPMPNLTSPIESQGGSITVTDGSVSIPQGVNVGRGNTIFNLSPTAAVEAEFAGELTRQGPGATVNVLTNPTANVKFNSAEGADANGVMPYATFNNTDFATYSLATGELSKIPNYTPFLNANSGDAAEAVGGVSLPNDKEVSVLKSSNAVVNGGGNALTTNAILVKGVNASFSDLTIKPHDQPGADPNELILLAPVGGDRLTLTNVNIVDNGDPTILTFSAPQGGRMTINDTFTYTGETNITSGTVILNGANAGLGGDDVFLGAGALLRIVNNILPQNVTFGTGPFPAKVEADGDSTVTGDITVEVNSRNDRSVRLIAPQSSDNLTVTGTFTRGGMGNPIEGHGKAIVELGETFGDGDITIASTADLTDPNIVTTLNGDQGRNFFINGQLGDTVILGDIEIAGVGSATRFTDLRVDGTISDATHSLAPGASIGAFTVTEDLLMRGSNFTYDAEIDDAGDSDLLAIGGVFDISTPNDTLDISFFTGSTLAAAEYTLATYGSLVGEFDTVIFDGVPVVNPTAPGAIGGTHRLMYGVNALMLKISAPLQADFDNDGDVDGDDFLIWQSAFGTNTNGDADNDGDTDGDDFLIWQSEFGAGVGSASVPEPSSLATLLLLSAVICRTTRRWA